MRIAHLPSSYFPDSLGGTEVYVRSLCDELQQLGHATAVVWHSETTDGLPERAFTLQPIEPLRRSHIYTRFTGQEPRGFRELLREWQPDVVHFHAFTLGAGGDHAECCRRRKIPYVITYHTPAMSCARGTMLRWGDKLCDGRIDAGRCAACSLQSRGWPRALARLASLSPAPHRMLPDSPLLPRIALPSILAEANAAWKRFFMGAQTVIACAEFCRDVLIANGVPAERIALERQALPGEDRLRTLRLPLPRSTQLRIGYFGRITAVKGPELLIPLVGQLRAGGIAVEGEWVGPLDGDRRWAEAIFAAAAPAVRYAGVKHGIELAAWIRGRDLIVIPSQTLETGPLTLLEAWNEGTPVIGSDRGGIRDFMLANGLAECLFPVGDTDAIAAAVRRMLDWNRAAPVVRVPGMRSLAERMLAVYEGACAGVDESEGDIAAFTGSGIRENSGGGSLAEPDVTRSLLRPGPDFSESQVQEEPDFSRSQLRE
ncbi:MAG: glycosyltransferase [Pirellulales bacterium]